MPIMPSSFQKNQNEQQPIKTGASIHVINNQLSVQPNNIPPQTGNSAINSQPVFMGVKKSTPILPNPLSKDVKENQRYNNTNNNSFIIPTEYLQNNEYVPYYQRSKPSSHHGLPNATHHNSASGSNPLASSAKKIVEKPKIKPIFPNIIPLNQVNFLSMILKIEFWNSI